VDPDPTFIQGLVLVKGGQSQQEYRACLNLVEANTRIMPAHHPVPDCATTVHELQGATCFSALDIKAGFNNIPIAEDCLHHIGVITQDGLFRLERMTFGFNTAPSCF